MTRPSTESELLYRRHQRHESHVNTTYAAFIRHVRELAEVEEAVAERAAVAVLGALEQRIQPTQARNLEAQLPRRLVELLPAPELRPQRPLRFGKELLVESVAEVLQKPLEEAEWLVRCVFLALQDQISEGEADDVASNLPPDLQALWRISQ
ncbi:DUF2267 domain-containing protein [Myxococcaceae bacterium JPH2]|nr:DUF2267 domain-containing protein [Myxococcaceae bacterium JPH2]